MPSFSISADTSLTVVVAGCVTGGVALYKNHQTQKAVEGVKKDNESTKLDVQKLMTHKDKTTKALENLNKQLADEKKAREDLELRLTKAIDEAKDELKQEIAQQDKKITDLETSIQAIK